VAGREDDGSSTGYAASASGSSSSASSSRSDAAVAVKVDGGVDAVVDDGCVAVERDERRREHRPHEVPHGGAQRAAAARQGVAELALHPLGAERLGAGDIGEVEYERDVSLAARPLSAISSSRPEIRA
jgi:hypothetical protein